MLFLAKNGGSKMITLRRFVRLKHFWKKIFFKFFTWDLSDSLFSLRCLKKFKIQDPTFTG
jgi:hypothetical protein